MSKHTQAIACCTGLPAMPRPAGGAWGHLWLSHDAPVPLFLKLQWNRQPALRRRISGQSLSGIPLTPEQWGPVGLHPIAGSCPAGVSHRL